MIMRKLTFSFLFFIIFLPTLDAQTTIKIWEEYHAATKKMLHSEITAYIAQKNSSGTAVIICPGGSYRYLGMNVEGKRIAKWLQHNGISAFVLRYRVGRNKNHHPAMIQDLQRAIQLVKENHLQYNIDTTKIGVMGFSAGGHLAGTAATYYQRNYMETLGITPSVSLRPDFAVMIYPVVSMMDSIAHRKSRANLLGRCCSAEDKATMSLDLNVHNGMPPVFLMHCRYDKTVDYRNAFYYQKALKEKDVPCKFLLYDERGHGFGINPNSRKRKAPAWINELIPWLKDIEMN